MQTIPFVDAHIHLWDLDRLDYPWLTAPFSADGLMGSVAAIASNYTVPAYRSDSAGWNAVGCVHIDAGAQPGKALAETEWLEAIAESEGLPTGIVAFATLHDERVEEALERQAAHPRVRGIRQIANWHADPFFTYTPENLLQMPAWQKGFSALARYGLSFDLQAYPQQFHEAAALFARNPDVPVILNHCGMPMTGHPAGFATWQAGLKQLSALPQVSVKMSGFGIMNHTWSTEAIRPYVLETIALFGTKRCMFASDFPTDKLYTDFDTTLGAYETITREFSDDEKRDLFGRNANRVYRLGLSL